MYKQISLNKNIIFNLISQVYATIIALILLPFYIKYMGAEAYGIVGFFTVLQSIFAIIDFGLSPTISRETAKMRGSANYLEYRKLYRTLNILFILIAITGGLILYLNSEYIGTKWLNPESINFSEIILSIKLMSIIVALRWLTGLYKGVIIGSEEIVWLAIVNIVFSSFRFIGVFIYMSIYGYTPYNFFIFQLVVIILEYLVLLLKSQTLLPPCNLEEIGWSIKPIKKVLKFSLMIAFTSIVWILVTQTDKLILSGILPLKEYGYYSLAVLLAGGIMTIVAPITSPITPRMTKLFSEKKIDEMLLIYKNTTEIVLVVAGTISLILCSFSYEILYIWTQDNQIAKEASPILQLYAIGNGFLSLSACPSYLQQAIGNLKYHFIGNMIILFTLIPLSIFSAIYYGAIGAGFIWLLLNFLFFFIWVFYSHSKLVPKFHLSWLLNNIFKVFLPPFILTLLISFFYKFGESRIEQFFSIIVITIIIFLLFIISTTKIRNKIFYKLKEF